MRNQLTAGLALSFAVAGLCTGQSTQCPRIVPAEVHMFLPAALPPGPYPFVREQVQAWVYCDTAPTGGVVIQAIPSDSRTSVVVSGTARSPSDSTYQSPNLEITTMSTSIGSPGTFNAPVKILTPDGRTASLPVTVTITAAPLIRLSDSVLVFTSEAGSLDDEYLTVWTINAATPIPVSLTAESPGWLSVTPGNSIGYSKISVHVNPAQAALGDSTGYLVIAAADAANSPVRVPVRLFLTPPVLTLFPAALSFTQAAGGPAPKSLVMTVYSNRMAFPFAVTSDAAWLTVSPTAGNTQMDINVSVSGAGLSPGTYTGNLTVTAAGAAPVKMQVSLTVTP